MSPAQMVRLVATREVVDRLHNKMYVLGTLGLAVAVVGVIVLPGVFDDGEPDRIDLGVVGEVPASFGELLAAGGDDQRIEVVELDDREAAAEAVSGGEVDAALLDSRALMAEGVPDMGVRTAVEGALQRARTAEQLERTGLSGEEVAAVMAPQPPLVGVDTSGEEADLSDAWMVAFAATILLFVAVTINASSLLTGAVEEKSSGVIEVLLGSVRPWHLLAGKIIALTGLALGQLGLVVGAALVANAATGAFELPAATTATVVTGLVMLLIGFVFYAALYTVAGSLASTTEDAQGSAGPLGFIVMGAYFVVIFAVMPNPRGVWAQVLSYLPPTAPLTVPARVAFDAMPLWQVAVSVGVTLLGVTVTVWLAARLYAASLLAGGKLTWRAAWRAEPIR